MRTSNPILKDSIFTDQQTQGSVMTLQGTINKSFLLIGMVFAFALLAWNLPELNKVFSIGGAIAGFITALVTIFKKEWSPITAPLYAIFEGLFLGAISLLFEMMFPGIAFQAIMLTIGVFLCLLFIYKAKIIQATENFKMGLLAATGAIALIYLVGFIGSFFDWQIPYIHESGWIGIGFSLVVVVIAALNLILDFDFIEKGSQGNSPKYMEWYASFGLLVTLVWLYLEILRLLSKLGSRD